LAEREEDRLRFHLLLLCHLEPFGDAQGINILIRLLILLLALLCMYIRPTRIDRQRQGRPLLPAAVTGVVVVVVTGVVVA
jgi:hypothetical protein